MTKTEIYAILADTVNYTDNNLSFFLKRKVKKQVLADIETSIIRLFKKKEYFRISGDDIRAKQIDEVLDLLFKFRDKVKNEKL